MTDKKLILMILGVQRSGTTALFETLATADSLTSWHESDNSEIYFDWYLRPEPEIRSLLQSSPYPVLLKPVRESELRSPLDLLQEYAEYNLQMIWLYRDPVNVIYSYLQKGWIPDTIDEFVALAYEWNERNRSVILEAEQCQANLTAVRYEELLESPTLVHTLAAKFGLCVASGLRPDSMAGRANMASERQYMIDVICRHTLARMDTMRLCAEDSSVVNMDALKQQISKFDFRTSPYPILAAERSAARIHIYPDSGIAMIPSYKAAAPLIESQMLLHPAEKIWTYAPDESSSTLHSILGSYLNSSPGKEWAQGVKHAFEGAFTAAKETGSETDWKPVLQSIVLEEMAHVLGTNGNAMNSTGLLQALETCQEDPLFAALEPVAAGLSHYITIFLNCVMLHCLLNPEFAPQACCGKIQIEAAITELLRYYPPVLNAVRQLGTDVEVGGHLLKQGSTIYLGIGAANRDPEAFEDPEVFNPHRDGPEPLTLMVHQHASRGISGQLLEIFTEALIRTIGQYSLSLASNGIAPAIRYDPIRVCAPEELWLRVN